VSILSMNNNSKKSYPLLSCSENILLKHQYRGSVEKMK